MEFCLTSLLLLAAALQAATVEDLPGPCRKWSHDNDWLCTSEETYQRCQYTPRPGCPPKLDKTPSTPPSGDCELINGTCQFTNSPLKCLGGWNCDSQYCLPFKDQIRDCPSHGNHQFPNPDMMCLPINKQCQWFNPCRAWKGHCLSPYQCGTLSEYYKFIYGPVPVCPAPPKGWVEPIPPGSCVINSTYGECRWSNCTTFIDWCGDKSWLCDTEYNRELFYASPVPPCHPSGQPPPLPSGKCQFSVEHQKCQFSQEKDSTSEGHSQKET